MARTNKVIDATTDDVETAKETAITLMQGTTVQSLAQDLFFTDNLVEVETGLKKLNEFSKKSWILSSIILYSLIYNKSLYTQSGLTWDEYLGQARQRIGMEKRDISEQLSAARFFIQNHVELERKGYDINGSNRKLARAELATELCGNVHTVIDHLVKDTWEDFKDWYSSFKTKEIEAPTEYKRQDIDIKGNRVYIQGIEAVKVSEKIPPQDKERIEKYIGQIFDALRKGYEPAIVDCYDEREARNLVNLRDKYRQRR